MSRMANDVFITSLKYLEIYDIFAFMMTNKRYFYNLQMERLFASHYENPDILFVALCDNCKEPNKRMLFLNLCTEKRSFKSLVFDKLSNDYTDIELIRKVMSIGANYSDRSKEIEQFMNQSEKILRNIHWIWEDISFKNKRKEPLSEEYKKRIKTLPKKGRKHLREPDVEDTDYYSFIKARSYNYNILSNNYITNQYIY